MATGTRKAADRGLPYRGGPLAPAVALLSSGADPPSSPESGRFRNIARTEETPHG